jgi:hypothetical protein
VRDILFVFSGGLRFTPTTGYYLSALQAETQTVPQSVQETKNRGTWSTLPPFLSYATLAQFLFFGSGRESFMFCIACGTPLAAGLSYCNRCGTSLKERSESKTGTIAAFLTAITLIGTIGLGIMLGGAVTLKREGELPVELIGFFMLFTFITIIGIEILLFRQLSKLTSVSERNVIDMPQHFPRQFVEPSQLSAPQRSLTEPIPSVTENTTRTLEYSRNEPAR